LDVLKEVACRSTVAVCLVLFADIALNKVDKIKQRCRLVEKRF